MAKRGKSGGASGRKPGKRRPPPGPDWEAFTEQVKGDLIDMGFDEAEAEAEAALKCERTRLRHAWFRERFDAFIEMQDKAGEAYLRYMDERPEIDWESPDAPEVPEPPEAVMARALYDEVMEAVKEDRWPRHLHFRDV